MTGPAQPPKGLSAADDAVAGPPERAVETGSDTQVKAAPTVADDPGVTVKSSGSVPAASVVALRVLYIEDHPSNVRLVERVLARRGDVWLQVARTGQEGLRLAAALPPDVVLLDLHLPDLSGEEVLARLWQLPLLANSTVLVLTADALPDTAARLRAAGAADCLTKPLDVAALDAALDLVLAALRSRDQAC